MVTSRVQAAASYHPRPMTHSGETLAHGGMNIEELFGPLFLAGWIALQWWILPALGVPT